MDTFKRKTSKSRHTSPATNEEKLVCEIIMLDPTQPNFIVSININENGNALLDTVCSQLGGILEKDYFGLRFLDKHGQRQWLELNKTISKQIKDKNNSKNTQMFSFRFKHYPKYPCEDLKQDLSRYLLYLQLRRDLYRGRLVGSSNEQYQMAALILQAEIGEFEMAEIENSIKITDLKILPHINRKAEMKILGIHETLKDIDAKDAERQFLEEAAKLQTYGVEPIPVKDQKGNELFVGVVEDGISTFSGSKRTHTFPWENILKLSYSHKMFMFQVYMDQRKHILGFKCESTYAACALWKWALDRKCFFTLEKGSQARRSRSGGSLFRKKKIHTFSGMSQKELTQSCENLQNIPQPHVSRAQSMVTLMRSISSRNESSNFNEHILPNGINSTDKGYSTLPRCHEIKSFYSEPNDQPEESNKKNNKNKLQKTKSTSAAVGAVLDFMQALKDTPVISRSFESSPSEVLPFNDSDQVLVEPSVTLEKDESDGNIVSEMIEMISKEESNMNQSTPVLPAVSNIISSPKPDLIDYKPLNFQFSFILISIIMLLVTMICGANGPISSFIRWVSNLLTKFFFEHEPNTNE